MPTSGMLFEDGFSIDYGNLSFCLCMLELSPFKQQFAEKQSCSVTLIG